MADVSEYKCPSCGAPMRFEISGQSVVCRSCSKTYDIEYMRSHFDEVNDEKLSDFDWINRTEYVWEPYELDKLEEFECSSCGGKIVTKSFYASAKCPYCKQYVIIPSDLDGDIRPDKVIPFKNTSKEFWDKYTDYLSEFKRVPKEFRSKSVQKSIVGHYIPVWRYNCKYIPQEKYEVSVTDYPILANDADVKEEVFYSLLPYEYKDEEDFTESCLVGFCASRYIIGAENAMKMVDSVLDSDYNDYVNAGLLRFERKADEAPVDTGKKLDRLLDRRLNKYVRNRDLAYYLVPVWLLKIKYQDEEFTYAMNGQTGNMRVDRIPRKPRFNFLYWLAVIILVLLIILFFGLFFYYGCKDNPIGAIFLLLGGIMVANSSKIAKHIRRKTSLKKVYLNSKRFDEQKVWSLDDFSEKHIFKNKKYRKK